MMVLRRYVGEVVVLSRPDGTEIGRVVVTDAKLTSHAVKVGLGFEFPAEVRIDRLEVWTEKQTQLKEQSHAEGKAE